MDLVPERSSSKYAQARSFLGEIDRTVRGVPTMLRVACYFRKSFGITPRSGILDVRRGRREFLGGISSLATDEDGADEGDGASLLSDSQYVSADITQCLTSRTTPLISSSKKVCSNISISREAYSEVPRGEELARAPFVLERGNCV